MRTLFAIFPLCIVSEDDLESDAAAQLALAVFPTTTSVDNFALSSRRQMECSVSASRLAYTRGCTGEDPSEPVAMSSRACHMELRAWTDPPVLNSFGTPWSQLYFFTVAVS